MTKRIRLFLAGAVMLNASAYAAPGLINYQGQITDPTGEPVTSEVEITFTFHDVESGGVPLGSFSDIDSVGPDSFGIYSTLVGDDDNLIPAVVFDGDVVWLNVNVEGEDLVPRLRVSSAGFAIHAGIADFADHAAGADTATVAQSALHADSADVATMADLADHAATADTATTAGLAFLAEDANALQGLQPPDFLNMAADAYVIVKTTSNAVQNGANLLDAYTAASALSPSGAVLSATNRAVVLVPPGTYDLGSDQIELDVEYVDLIGLSSARDHQYIHGESNGPGTGVIRQTADDVRIENLVVQCTWFPGSAIYSKTTPAAYFPDTILPKTVVRNCEFLGTERSFSMRYDVRYSGVYSECKGGADSFGSGSEGLAEGTFTDCTAGSNSFGHATVAKGTFTNCTGGEFSFGAYGQASGKFVNCTGGASSFGGQSGLANGTFIDCVGGDYSFGGLSGSTTGGRLYGCRVNGLWSSTFNGRMEGCFWGTGMILGSDARVYNSTFLGHVNLDGSTAGIANCYIRGSVLNAGLAVFNSGNVQSIDVY